ncbi:hypothetical protein ARMGADRAFT_778489 [Armillaria gallica]|uniref:Uncharacterized protein n=1 Tax=Armillaria gallica TaxID=47427 RepID=A0A2H3CEH8_ARMGA|nr:hypothetical protein ARMGADRAFT_778489 [Armillaria gallica]
MASRVVNKPTTTRASGPFSLSALITADSTSPPPAVQTLYRSSKRQTRATHQHQRGSLNMNAQLHTPCLQPDADTCCFLLSLGLCPATLANLCHPPVSDDARLSAVSRAFPIAPCQIPFDPHGRYAQYSELHD